ncbi:acetyltransferase family protein [Sphingomonas sp. S17]|jgi:GNAT superfamily N-acetyltransferase|uniref:GNAT family N-acetyltransferase n=2 Tax=Sphingomonas paucimobilis TaxID=13689 RepID=A0A411LM65_SPHPI|nr:MULTISPECIES: GNAT family N-acetyltransferase [Sphingomonas]EGI53208.1 acetyltransferase family protein [Sphingomonas sp. S17]MBQ1479304.1 GNAT family N-acetyltransferase [Sphingomonas sp.]MCM3679930.1 GNAT family N-acetyltransferase [Sphingomonas paucimobilis]MDG5970675.1 GNAT family N-acetyltransferase [Sphingomonas paucimobilis]NNG59108.1 GNAT family N-acetyltransferase [Sphingomonas paucimobilis]
MALIPVDPAEIATIVTTLEMRERPRPRPMPPSPLSLSAWKMPDLAKYRTLFRRVGAPWLWFSRLVMDDATLAAIVHDPAVAVFAVVDRAGIEVGMLELDHRQPGACEISYFGLIPELAGQGHGGWLIAQALMRAWTTQVDRVWVHTCTLDHPAALNFYRKQGFEAVSRAIETFPDPRDLGILPEEAAPQIPRLTNRR